MTSAPFLAAGLLALCGPVWAQAGAAAPAASAASAPAIAARGRPHIVVIEDDGARIEESRINGRVQRVIVQSKIGNVQVYEIQVAPAGRDPSQERGNAGQRTWSIFNF